MEKQKPIVNIYVILLFLACLVSFIVLARSAHHQHLLWVDISTARDAQRQNSGFLHSVFNIISLPGKPAIAGASILITAVLLWLYKYPREALFILAAGGADALSLLIKYIVNRPGPQQVTELVAQKPEATFPSSHLVHYIVFFGLLAFFMLGLNKLPGKLRVTVALISILLILAIPFARILLAEHWVSDVLGGSFLGLMSLIMLLWLYSSTWFLPKLKKRL